jgi:UPF0042 nucleotide-binding protein
VVVTGLSGAGKSATLHALEDLGYFCVDNLPLQLLPSLTGFYRRFGQRLSRIAVGVDTRTRLPAREIQASLVRIRREGFRTRVLFLDSDNGTLLRRFSETRRRHPLSGSVERGIAEERRRLREVKGVADKIIDTSRLTPSEVKEVVAKNLGLSHPEGMAVTVASFGYKYGLPLDADLVWDVRFLPNPNYVPALRQRTGLDAPVSRFVLRHPQAQRFLGHMRPLLDFLLDGYSREGKSYLTIAVGCTGGRHRSVAIAEALAAHVRRQGRTDVRVRHRDAGRRS